jgi:hypothetical protein
MVLTRWSAQNGTLVTPNNATVFSGSAQIPVTTGEIDFNVYSLIDADLGGIFALIPERIICIVAWQIIFSLVLSNPGSKSAFGGNPIRRKLGLMTYGQGVYALDNEPINYPLQICSRQNFTYAEGLPEPSLSALSPLPAPVARDYIITPTGAGLLNLGLVAPNYGKTRALISLETGIIGVAEVSYIATLSGAIPPLQNDSILVSQL